MKRAFALGFALALVSSAFAACTMNFDQFTPSGGGTAGNGGTAGTGGTMNCNGGCCTALDCPTPQDPCKIAACTASKCGEDARQDGTAVDMQTAGDCKKAVCMGGMVTNKNDDGDVFDDMNACTADTCDAGMPKSAPTAAGTACSVGNAKVCDGQGNCVECLATSDCTTPDTTCDQGTHTCVPASCGDGVKNGLETDKDCGGGQCPPCDVGGDCKAGSDCTSGVCNPGGKCEMPKCNDGVQNGTETDVDCGQDCPNQCGPGQGCNANPDCTGDNCTGVNGTCVPTCTDKVLNNGESDVDCGGNNCNGCGLGKECAGMDGNCLSNFCDANSKCAQKDPNGSMCASAATCDSGNCTDMVCCGSPCQGMCRACNLMGTVGACTNIPAGQDPNSECGAGQACNGNGGCDKLNGQACGNGNECLTNNCIDGVCCATTCNGLCKSCNVAGSAGTCTNIVAGQDPANECTGATSCDGNGACLKLTNGTACGVAGECQSGNCIDGVCCDMACGGLCKACNVAGSVGTCSNVPTGTDPANECADPTPNCNGMGACN
jgi:hypothetical protein